ASATQVVYNAAAQPVAAGAREIPARILPLPEHVSPQMRAVIGRPPNPNFIVAPQTTAEWKARVDQAARAVVASLPTLRESLGVTAEPTSIGAVSAYVVRPESVPEANRDRTLLHFHGGVRV